MGDAGGFGRRVDADRRVLDARMRPRELADGTIVRMAVFGQGPVLVCAPTVAQLGFVYMPHIARLQERFTVVLYEPRVSARERVSVDDRVRELRAVVAASGGRAHLLSWSDGGSAAYRFAAAHPDMCRSLMFLGLPDAYRFPGPLNRLAQLVYAGRVDRLVPGVAVRVLLAWFLGGPRVPRRWLFAETGRLDDVRGLLRFSILPCMVEHRADAAVPVPALVVGGDRDTLVRPRAMRRFADVLGRQASFVLIEGGEHMLGYAAPAKVNDAVEDFLARVA